MAISFVEMLRSTDFSTPGIGTVLAQYFFIPIAVMCALYLPVVRLLRGFMKNRKPLKLTYFTFVWSLVLSVLSLAGLYIAISTDPALLKHVVYPESEYSAGSRMVIAVFCLTKVLEFGDTIILLLKKKPVIFLHTYHHLTVAMYCWHAMSLKVRFAHCFVLMNLAVHSLMYFYYALTTVTKMPILARMRPLITFSQIIQMFFGIAICGIAFHIPAAIPDSKAWWNAQLGILMYVSYFYLFSVFFFKNYISGYRPGMCTLMLMTHSFALYGLSLVIQHPRGLRIFTECITLYILTGLGITCGAHRLWSHRSYKAHFLYRTFLLVLNSIANQGTIFRWCRDHRTHHRYSEKEADPHNASRGFFYSHIGWLLLDKPEAVKLAGQEIDVSDLYEDSLVMLQKRLDPWWNQTFCFLLPSLYGYYVYGDFWLGFFTLGTLRWIICLHATWTINSVAHMWGDRPYNPSINPAENLFASIVAVGEGWHNWHHEFPFDYATAEGGFLTHWNPSKMVIDIGAYLGLVYDRRRATDIWSRVKARRLAVEKEKAEAVAAGLKKNSSILKLSAFHESLPPQLTRKSLVRSIMYLFRDIVFCSLLAGLSVLGKYYAVNWIAERYPTFENFVNFIFWVFYALAQGTAVFALWVLGYEAAGGRFCEYRVVNHAIGMILHPMMLIPYVPRRGFKEKERERASLCRCLSENSFAILKVSSWKHSLVGTMAVACFIGFYAVLGNLYGWGHLVKYYVGPWLVLNLWLITYEWLLDNGPQDNMDCDLSESTLQLFTAEWLVAAWPVATRGRKYPWSRLVDHLHHHLSLSHVVQAVDLEIPHYHLKDVFGSIGDILETVSTELSDVEKKLVNSGLKISPDASLFSSVLRARKYIG